VNEKGAGGRTDGPLGDHSRLVIIHMLFERMGWGMKMFYVTVRITLGMLGTLARSVGASTLIYSDTNAQFRFGASDTGLLPVVYSVGARTIERFDVLNEMPSAGNLKFVGESKGSGVFDGRISLRPYAGSAPLAEGRLQP